MLRLMCSKLHNHSCAYIFVITKTAKIIVNFMWIPDFFPLYQYQVHTEAMKKEIEI